MLTMGMTPDMKNACRLQFITHFTEKYSYLDSAMMALEGGCRWIQLRMKDATEEEVERTAGLILPECRRRGAVFIIDDHVEAAMKAGADGVHLGKNDMPVDKAREMSGSGFIIGGTANTFEDISRLAAQGADYIGCGPFRFTTTKKNLAPVLGLEGYRRLVRGHCTADSGDRRDMSCRHPGDTFDRSQRHSTEREHIESGGPGCGNEKDCRPCVRHVNTANNAACESDKYN